MMGEGGPDSDVDMALNTSAFVHLRNSVEALMSEGVYRLGIPPPWRWNGGRWHTGSRRC